MRSRSQFKVWVGLLGFSAGANALWAAGELLPGLPFGELAPREVRVFVPPSGVTASMPVVFALDGQTMAAWRLEETLSRISTEGKVTAPLVVTIAAGNDRLDEYGMAGTLDYAGRGRKAAVFQRWLIEIVLPAVRDRHGVSATPERTGVFGASLGGLAAFDLAWRHPETIGFVGIFSGSLWWRGDDTSPATRQDSRLPHRLVRTTPRPPHLRLWFEAGAKDETSDRDNNGVIDSIQDTRELLTELGQHGFRRGPDLRYTEIEDGEHNEATWARVLPEFFEWALPLAR